MVCCVMCRSVFVFFKQKTAYEMRISDWSSDVCSSDLIDFGLFNERLSGSIDYFKKTTTDALFEQTLAQPAPAGRIWVKLDGEIVNEGVEIALDIGRASCRERVCKYV